MWSPDMQTPEYQQLLRANRWKLLHAQPGESSDDSSDER
jgi:hypothetical protein